MFDLFLRLIVKCILFVMETALTLLMWNCYYTPDNSKMQIKLSTCVSLNDLFKPVSNYFFCLQRRRNRFQNKHSWYANLLSFYGCYMSKHISKATHTFNNNRAMWHLGACCKVSLHSTTHKKKVYPGMVVVVFAHQSFTWTHIAQWTVRLWQLVNWK